MTRPHFRTRALTRRRDRRTARLRDLDVLFARNTLDVKARLEAACRPYDRKLAAIRQQQLQATHNQDHDRASFRLGTSGRRPQLWQVEGDGCGQ